MKLLRTVPVLVGLLGVASAVAGEEIPHVDFVRALKSEYGPKLADEYLKRLQLTAPGEFTPRLALEFALVKLELAEKAATATERVRLTREAEVEIRKYPGPEARLTSVKILNIQARALQLKASREDDESDARKKGMAQAAGVFQEVGRQLDETMKQLAAEIPKAADAKAKRILEEAMMQAELDLGINLFDRAEYPKAREMFDKVAFKKDTNPALWVMARAWVGRCMIEQDSDAPNKIIDLFKTIEADHTLGAEAGRRDAAYFRLLQTLRMLNGAAAPPSFNPIVDARLQGTNWLKQYAEQGASTQTAGIHYILGRAAYEESRKQPATAMAKRKDLYEEARKHFRLVEQTDNDFTGKARNEKLKCFIIIQGWSKDASLEQPDKLREATANVPLQKLTTFEDLVDRSQFELARMRERLAEVGLSEDKITQIRTDGIKRMIEALQAGVALAEKKDSKVPDDQLSQARMMLTFAYLSSDDAVNTIAYGEKLVREKIGSSQAPDAAIYVLQGYSTVLRQLKVELKKRSDAVEKAKDKDEETKLKKLRDETAEELKQRTANQYSFMDHVTKVWPEEQAADVARHQKGMMLYNDKKYPEAIETLAQVRPSYAAYIPARYQLAIIAWHSATDEDKPTATDPDKRPWKERAIAVCEQLPPPQAGADPSVNESYARAKMMLANPYFKATKFKEMDAAFMPLVDSVEKGQLMFSDKDVRRDLQASLLKCVLLSAYGKADQHIQAATKQDPKAVKFHETRPFFDPVYPWIFKEAAIDVMKPLGKDPKRDADAARFRNVFMEMILRAYMLDGKGVEAAQLVRALNKFYPEKDDKGDKSDGGAVETVEPLINQVVGYIADLRAAERLRAAEGKKDEAAAKKVEADKLAGGFAAFLDEASKDLQVIAPEYYRLLAKGYLSLEQPGKAVALVKNDPGAPAAGAPAAKVQAYVEGRLLLVRGLREEKKLDDADAALAALKKQDEALVAQKQPALFADEPLYLIEECRLLDARGKFKESAGKWSKVANKLKGHVNQSKREKDLYFEAYCNWVQAGYRIALTFDEPKKSETIKKAAGAIIDLEDVFGDLGGEASKFRFLRLLDNEIPLKEAYATLKAAKKGS